MKWNGWFQVAFAQELGDADLFGVNVGDRRLMIRAEPEGVGCFDAACPHRGADLSQVGTCLGDLVRCPFHGLSIRLGYSPDRLSVKRYDAFIGGGIVFAHLGTGAALPLQKHLVKLGQRFRFVPAFAMAVQAPHTLITENAFDALHFEPVHKAVLSAVSTQLDSEGIFSGLTEMTIPSSPWQQQAGSGMINVPLDVRAFGSGVVVSEIGGSRPYVTVTAATPLSEAASILRLAMGFPHGLDDSLDEYMIRQALRGVEADQQIWETMVPGSPQRLLPEDASVKAFADYCRTFVSDE